MKYLLIFIGAIYQLLLLACIISLIGLSRVTDWEMGESFIFIVSLLGIIIFGPLAIWSYLVYRKWPVNYPRLQIGILGGILVVIFLTLGHFFK